MDGARRNLELKALDPDPERSRRACEELGAEPRGVLRQEDTYFDAREGRLKLRREEGARSQLIAYQRADEAAGRESRYRIVEIEDGAGLQIALAGALGVRAVVRKARRLFLHGEVRIHLDRVDGLGDFVELEAVAGEGEADLGRLERPLAELRDTLRIRNEDLVGESYCDLILALDAKGRG